MVTGYEYFHYETMQPTNLSTPPHFLSSSGVWELPMNSHFKDFQYQGGFCPYLDQCNFSYQNEPEVLEWLISDFERHYTTNR